MISLEIPIEYMLGKWKVSQNRSATDRRGVPGGLGQDADAMAALVAVTL
ncbi:hypothetical protein [Solidesulfovibrio carbinolicus]|nr:hypothetical protein [Solidesulfovibrio carbinolicus]